MVKHVNPNKYIKPIIRYRYGPVIKLAIVGPIIPAIAQPDNVIACTVETLVVPKCFDNNDGKTENVPP